MDTKLIDNVKEAATLVGISAGIGFLTKKMLKKSVINDPSTDLMNFGTWTAVMVGAIFARDYLIKQNILPKTP